MRLATPNVELDEASARRLVDALGKLETTGADHASLRIVAATKLQHTETPLQLTPTELHAVLVALRELRPHDRTPQLAELQIALGNLVT
jgi:hypothetical protein